MPNINEIIPKSAIDGILAANKAITDIDSRVQALSVSTDALAKTLQKGGISFAELAKQQKVVSDNAKQLSDEQKKLEDIEKKQAQTTNAIVEARLKASEATKQQKLEVERKIQTDKKEGQSINALRTRNKQLLEERNRVNTATKKGQAEIKRLNAELDKNNKKIKENSDALSKQKQNVGNYQESIIGAAGSMGLMGGVTQKVTTAMNFFAVSLKTLRGALISTGIGALVVAFGSLAAYFDATEEGAAKLQKILAPFRILFYNLRDVAADLGERLLWAFDNPKQAIANLWTAIKQNLINRLNATVKFLGSFGDILQGIWELDKSKIQQGAKDAGNAWLDMLTGVEDTANKSTDVVGKFIKDIARETREETKKQIQLIEDQLQLDKRRRAFLLEEGKLQGEIAKNRKDANDKEIDAFERQKAINLAISDTNKLADLRKGIAEEELRLLKENAALSKSDGAVLDAIAAKEREILDIETTRDATQKLMVTRRYGINEEIRKQIELENELLDVQAQQFSNADEQDIPDIADDPQVKAAAQRNLAIIELAQKSAKESLAVEEIKLSELQALYDKGLINFEEFEATKTQIQESESEKRLEIAQASLQAASMISDFYFQQEQNKLSQLSAQYADSKAMELELAAGNQEQINAINQKYAKKEAELKRKQAAADKQAAIFRTVIAIAEAVTVALSGGPVVGIVLAGITAALGAVQLASILSQPIPQFAKGTDSTPKTFIAGEAGRELMDYKGKQFLIDKPTLFDNYPGAKIRSNAETERILNASTTGYDSPDIRSTLIANNDKLIKAIKDKRELHINARKGEITDRRGKYWQTYKNAYFN